MKTIEDLLAALDGCETKIGVKRVLHEYGAEYGWSNRKSSDWVNAVWANAVPVPVEDETPGSGPRAKLARLVLNAGDRDRSALRDLTWLNSQVAGHYWYAMKRTDTAAQEALKAKEEERGRALFEEVQKTTSDDELYALLLRRSWPENEIANYIGVFGHSDAAARRYEKSSA